MRFLIGFLLSIQVLSTARAQDATSAPATSADGLRAEILLDRTLIAPGQPAWARFTLVNTTDAPIEIPFVRSTDDSEPLALPLALIFGSDGHAALQLSYDNQRAEALRAPAGVTVPATDSTIRLAPRAALGREIELRTLSRDLRYSGRFHLEWKPAIARAAPAAADFFVESHKRVVMMTDFGNLTFNLMYDKAPRNIENFLELVRERFYDGKSIHRIVPEFIIQAGSPDGASGGIRADGRTIPAEFHNAPFQPGTLAMALKFQPATKSNDPNSASCQFFISLSRLPELDGKYTVIGQAADEATLRTLERLAAQPANENGKPTRPIIMNFVTLVDAEEAGAKRLELSTQP